MKALVYDIKPLGWVTCKWLKRFRPSCVWGRLGGLSLRDVPVPELPGADWVRLRTRLGGLCGTDLGIIAQKQPPNSILQAFSSMPMVLGHENVAVVEDVGSAVDASWLGRRVCVEPTLGCTARGIEPPCERCAQGQYGACENFGDAGGGKAKLPPGTSIGYNRRTGGAFGEFFVAHQSQLVAVPEGLSDEQAILTDPLACSLHAALRVDLSQARRVLVYGSGVLGLGLIGCLRAIGYTGWIDALDVHAYLAELATEMGADEAVRLGRARRERFEEIARRTGATVQRARFGNYMLSGGYDIVFDCVGSSDSISESLKWTRARGQVVLIGTGHGGKLDLTPIWFRELHVLGAYGRQKESLAGRREDTYRLVHEMLTAGALKADKLLTHTFPLEQYGRAIEVSLRKARHKAVKVAFDFRSPA